MFVCLLEVRGSDIPPGCAVWSVHSQEVQFLVPLIIPLFRNLARTWVWVPKNPVQGIWERGFSSLRFISSIFALCKNLRSLLGLQSGGLSRHGPPRYSQRFHRSIGHSPIKYQEVSSSSLQSLQVGEVPGSIRLWCLFKRLCPVIIWTISPSSFLGSFMRYLDALLLTDGNHILVCLASSNWYHLRHQSLYISCLILSFAQQIGGGMSTLFSIFLVV